MSDDDSTDQDDDWFEEAIEGADDEGGESTDQVATGEAPGPSDGVKDDPEDTRDETADTGGSDSPFGDSDGGDSPFTDSGGGSPFDDSGEESPFDDDSGGSPFDDDSGRESPFDDDSGDDEGGLFDDDFASAFDSAGGDGDGSGEFENEDFDSEIPRIDIGIEGLDRMIQGGIPERHLVVTIGSAGTGKTTFGLQFLHHGLEIGENCIYITLEQSYESIMDTASDRDWEFERYEEDGQLAVVDLDPVEMANSLDNIRGELPTLIEDFDADRLVLDSVSLLEMMYDDQAKRRTEVFDFTRALKNAGVTTMLTSEASEDNPYASRHGIIEYLTDAVFILQYVRSETRETRLAVEIQKIRNANHSRETKPYEITMDGISVYQQANIF
ncbi:KaiC domain-containing protein [Haloarcula pelagica]|uniref:KaiC domain-containing protein n=1 Tax=Haloarcula pelagica TaxID=3033389 RepID=UPI0024C36E9D|nr:KaiC domain-containing protein [Halomicroarcula sp. YJ-61-S]